MKSDQLKGFRPHSGASFRWEMGCSSVSKMCGARLGFDWPEGESSFVLEIRGETFRETQIQEWSKE